MYQGVVLLTGFVFDTKFERWPQIPFVNTIQTTRLGVAQLSSLMQTFPKERAS